MNALEKYIENGTVKKWKKLKQDKDAIEIINENCPDLTKPIAERFYLTYHKKSKTDVLCECGNETKFLSFNAGYRKYCSMKCANASESRSANIKSAFEKKYGGHPAKTEKVKLKTQKTNLKKYGTKHFTKSEQYKSKRKSNRKFVDILDKDYLKTQRDLNVPTTVLATEFDCTDSTIERYLKEYGIYESLGAPRNSFGQREVEEFLNSITDEKVISNTRKIISPLELDLYIPSLKIAIEYNGSHWHHDGVLDKNYHLNKWQMCKNQGIELISILDLDWYSNGNKIRNFIANKVANKAKQIGARKCVFKEISKDDAKLFCDLYHIDSYANCTNSLGLFYENELVSVLTYGKSRFNENATEVIRYCTKNDIRVMGGYSKLISKIDSKTVVSYHSNDLGISSSKFWTTMELGKPSYRYIKGNKILSRYQAQKKNLHRIISNFNNSLTEYENMTNNGWKRVWNSGITRLTKER